ncbi:hypothetical protein WOLCODRAFT_146122 [Wolfiporia cocos MD-104 SS10]|uniref:Uncharacterized protein n=1 Tax=Wolfiporia cocos (strain MD-104) TaxID=742152 RepID=A0A2H3J1L0_WOLCO|nr:hypothetical protein WOLCODRAFT_146122 [Wolfiporia cocos MD-104 SS10]
MSRMTCHDTPGRQCLIKSKLQDERLNSCQTVGPLHPQPVGSRLPGTFPGSDMHFAEGYLTSDMQSTVFPPASDAVRRKRYLHLIQTASASGANFDLPSPMRPLSSASLQTTKRLPRPSIWLYWKVLRRESCLPGVINVSVLNGEQARRLCMYTDIRPNCHERLVTRFLSFRFENGTSSANIVIWEIHRLCHSFIYAINYNKHKIRAMFVSATMYPPCTLRHSGKRFVFSMDAAQHFDEHLRTLSIRLHISILFFNASSRADMDIRAQSLESPLALAHPMRCAGTIPVYDDVRQLMISTGRVANICHLGPSAPRILVWCYAGRVYIVSETRGSTHYLCFVYVEQDHYQSFSSPYRGRYFLPFSINGVVGINAQTAYSGYIEGMDYADCQVFTEMSGSRPSIRIQPKNGTSYSHQFYVKRRGDEPITLRELATRIAQEVKRYLHGRKFREDPTPVNDVVLLGVTKVSDGSVQPELALIR